MKKILSLFILLFSLLLIYFLFSTTTATNKDIIKNPDCCVTICIYNQNGSPVEGCIITILETSAVCTTLVSGCCDICGLEEGSLYHYTTDCCQEINPIPSFTCRCNMTVDHYCETYQKRRNN